LPPSAATQGKAAAAAHLCPAEEALQEDRGAIACLLEAMDDGLPSLWPECKKFMRFSIALVPQPQSSQNPQSPTIYYFTGCETI